ncbi:MAG: class I SAM-dependent methyltransferase [Bosea sp. (in: a-proteobacteria)]|uniref:class I SAM-dependent methyltransferase n=1 Tax=Bosea sp. (in: a-proteobacteria) TaxID=1871050 RepID=UPI003F7B751F
MILDADQVRRRYDRTARFYDPSLVLYRMIGLTRQRKQSVELLNLGVGNTAVDLGCGTGANLSMLVNAAGTQGQVVGFDLSSGMLERARDRCQKHGWRNVQLVSADMRTAALPTRIDGAIATFALEMVPDHETVIQRVAERMAPGARFVALGLKEPERWPRWLINAAIRLNRAYGVSRDYTAIKPWRTLQSLLTPVSFETMYAGAAYRCVVERR